MLRNEENTPGAWKSPPTSAAAAAAAGVGVGILDTIDVEEPPLSPRMVPDPESDRRKKPAANKSKRGRKRGGEGGGRARPAPRTETPLQLRVQAVDGPRLPRTDAVVPSMDRYEEGPAAPVAGGSEYVLPTAAVVVNDEIADASVVYPQAPAPSGGAATGDGENGDMCSCAFPCCACQVPRRGGRPMCLLATLAVAVAAAVVGTLAATGSFSGGDAAGISSVTTVVLPVRTTTTTDPSTGGPETETTSPVGSTSVPVSSTTTAVPISSPTTDTTTIATTTRTKTASEPTVVPVTPSTPIPVTDPPLPPVTTTPAATSSGSTQSADHLRLYDLMASGSPDGGAALSDPSSPQSAAFAWLLADPSLPTYSDARRRSRYALAALYNGLGGGGEKNWERSDGWLGYGAAECSWFNVTCRGEDVTEVRFVQNVPDGTALVPEVAMLGQLEILELDSNVIKSTIPTEIGLMSSLSELLLRNNSFGGPIPTQLGNLELSQLKLHRNMLTGSVPSALGRLSNLVYLTLGDNDLYGEIPDLVGLSSLEVPKLYQNGFNSTIPASLGSMTSLTTLDLDRNLLSGSVPSSLGQLVNLERLVLQRNNLVGTMPVEVCDLRYSFSLSKLHADCTSEILCDCCTRCY